MLFFKTKEMLKDDFYNNLFKLNYIKDKDEIRKLIKINKKIASKVPLLKGWPENAFKFWDNEAAGWEQKISDKVRDGIKKELKDLKGLNLDIGSGSYAYVKNSVFLDLSFKMLKEIDGKKVLCKFKDRLPFKDNVFDSVTMIFVLNYLENLGLVFNEIKRVLKPKGKLVIVQPKCSTDDLYKFQEKKHYSVDDIKGYLDADCYEKKIDNKKVIIIKYSL